MKKSECEFLSKTTRCHVKEEINVHLLRLAFSLIGTKVQSGGQSDKKNIKKRLRVWIKQHSTYRTIFRETLHTSL